jgi:ParB-like chromosome segregation protein Spo0J
MGTKSSNKKPKRSKGQQQQEGKKSKDESRSIGTNTAKAVSRTLERIRVDGVRVIGKHRDVDREKVKTIAASMAMIGLRTPITVTYIPLTPNEWALVAGNYRLEAAKYLGWEHIDAFTIGGIKTDTRIWQLMENLSRAELTALERAEHVTELVQLVQESEKGGQVAHPGGKQPHDRGISRAAKALGFSREEVRRSAAIAGISADAKAKAKELGVDKNQSALLKIAKEKGSEAQLAKIEEIKTSKPAPASTASPSSGAKKKGKKKLGGANRKGSSEPDVADDEVKDSPSVVPESEHDDSESEYPDLPASLDRGNENERLFAALKAAWDNAPRSVRQRFVTEVLKADIEV